MLTRLLKLFSTRAPRSTPQPRKAQLTVEALEDRQLLSATLTHVPDQEPNNDYGQRLERAAGSIGWEVSAILTPHRHPNPYGWSGLGPDYDEYIFHVHAGEKFRVLLETSTLSPQPVRWDVYGAYLIDDGGSGVGYAYFELENWYTNYHRRAEFHLDGLGFALDETDVRIRVIQQMWGLDQTPASFPYKLKIAFGQDIEVSDARFDDDVRSVLFNRSATWPGSYNVKVYQSATPTFDPTNRPTLLGEQIFSESGASRIDLGKEIQVDPLRPYILVVADPDNTVSEWDKTNNLASFEHRITAKLVDGSLIVNGTNASDRIIVRRDGPRISVQGAQIFDQYLNGNVPSVLAMRVNLVQVAGRRGNDLIRLDQGTFPLTTKTLVTGGAGDDTIFGGRGIDWIYGGNGNDTLHGGLGNDFLFGDEGTDDKLFGDDGNDWLDAGSDSERDIHAGPRGDRDWNAYQWVKDGARMTDYAQQFRGNCFFLASLGALAERGTFDLMSPDRIRYKGEFTYEVKLFDGDITGDWKDEDGNWVIAHKGTNQWVWVTVRFDGTVASTDPRPTGRNEFGEFWFLLYRRAYLKLTGLLDEGGFPSDSLKALTGRDSTPVDNTADEEFFSRLEMAVNLHHRPVVALTNDPVLKPTKLVGPHAYIVLSVERRRGEPFAVTLWNPHGRRETVSWADFRKNMAGFDLHDGGSA